MKSYLVKFVYLVLLLSVFSGCRDEDVVVPEDPPLSAGTSKVDFYLSSMPLDRTDVKAVYVTIEKITLLDPSGNDRMILGAELPSKYNLLDSGLLLGSNVLDTGLYKRPSYTFEAYGRYEHPYNRWKDKGNSKLPPSYIEFNDGSIQPLYVIWKRTFCFEEDSFRLESGEETTILLEIDLEQSIRADTVMKKVKVCHCEPDDKHKKWDKWETIEVAEDAVQAHLEHGDYLGPCQDKSWSWWDWWFWWFYRGHHHGDEWKDKHGEPIVKYVFEPVLRMKPLPKTGALHGIYSGPRMSGREYSAFLYEEGKYSSTEADRNNPFPNALLSAELNSAGEFNFNELKAANYEIAIGEFYRGRFVRLVGINNNIVVISGRTTFEEIKN